MEPTLWTASCVQICTVVEVVEPSNDPFESDDEEAVVEDNDGLGSFWERVGSNWPSFRNIDFQLVACLDQELVTLKQMPEAEATEDENDDSENGA